MKIDKSKPIYLAGPMTGYPEHNYPRFAAATHLLRAAGFIIISPHETTLDPATTSWNEFLKAGITKMLTCQGVILLEGWEGSRGAILESELAVSLNMPVCPYDSFIVVNF